LIDSDMVNLDLAPISHIKIISHKDKEDWTLEPKYNLGKKRE